MSSSVRVNTRTSSPRRCTCTRTPSSLNSTAAGLIRSSAAVEVVAGRGEHRLHRPQQLERDRAQPGRAVGQRDGGDRAEVAAQHQRAADVGARHVRRLRDRVGHHAGERALADVAEQQRDEEALLVLGRAREQRRGPPRAERACEPAPASSPIRSNAASTSATVSDGSAAGDGWSRSAAQPTPIWRCVSSAGQPSDGGGRLGRAQLAQQRGQPLDLPAAGRGGAHGGGGVDELAQQHAAMVPP